ncbi:MAG: DUF2752 domain-containing protein [Culturomica sp.]|nr:DUF2752 domain-containing protein [Culturomica sp.]
MIDWLEAHQLSCWVKNLTGFECPGCGFQRAALCFLRGEWKEAFCLYPGVFPLGLFLLLAFLKIGGVKKISHGIIKKAGFVCLTTILMSYLLKLTMENLNRL